MSKIGKNVEENKTQNLSFEMLKDFGFHSKVPEQVLEKYEDKLPSELIGIWKSYGFGSFLNGYMKIINPDDYTGLLERSYYASDISIPIFATAFGDILTFRDKIFVGLINYRKKDCYTLSSRFGRFITQEPTHFLEFNKPKLQCENYEPAVQMFGKLNYDECFGYVPLLAWGGSEKVENLQKMKILPHIDLMSQAIGYME